VLCTYAGARFTYASLAEAIAPGQLTVKQMQTIYGKLDREKPELNDYNSWKERQDFNDILKLINDVSV
jgi:predicted choloylglycine hydrolase